MPEAGDLRHTVAIQELPEPATADSFGQPEATWETIATRAANIRELTGSESWKRRQVVAEGEIAVDLRYFPRLARWKGEQVGPQMRLVEVENGVEGRVLNIRAVVVDRVKTWMVVFCKS